MNIIQETKMYKDVEVGDKFKMGCTKFMKVELTDGNTSAVRLSVGKCHTIAPHAEVLGESSGEVEVGSLKLKNLFVYDGTLWAVSEFCGVKVRADSLFESFNFDKGTKVRRVSRVDVTVI